MSAASGRPTVASAPRIAPGEAARGHPLRHGKVLRRDTPRRHRRPIEAVLHAPQTLRALVRANEIWLVVVAAVIGAIAGVLVYLMTAAAQVAHVLLFEIDMDQHLSAQSVVDWHRALLVPPLGGLVLGGFSWLAMRYWPRRAVDPIEANALYGGRMSLNDSLNVALQTIISNGAGASIGDDRLQC